MIIRDYEPTDYDALVALWEEAGLPVKKTGRDAREALERQIASGAAFILLADDNGKIIGAILGSHDGRKGWLNRLAVAAPYRRAPLGVAVRLVAAAEERLRALGLEIFACLIERDNVASIDLFRKLDYERSDNIIYFRKLLRVDI